MAMWLFFALLAPLLFGVTAIFDKIVRDKHLGTFAFTIFIGLASVWLLALIPFVGISAVFVSPLAIIAGLVAGALLFLNAFPYFHALSIEEASRVAPLWAFEAPITLVLAFFFLKERLVVADYIGFVLVVMGAFLVSARNLRDTLKPTKAFWLMLLAATLTSIAWVLVKWLYSSMTFWPIQIIVGLGSVLAALVFLIANSRKVNFFGEFAHLRKSVLAKLGFRELAVTGAFLVFNLALMTGPASLDIALAQLSSFYAFFIAIFLSRFLPHILEEQIDRKTLLTKGIAIAMIIAGVFAISM